MRRVGLVEPTLLMNPVTSYIQGSWLPSVSGVSYPNPGNLNEPGASYSPASETDADKAMEAAHRAFPQWACVPRQERISLLRDWLHRIESERVSLANRITSENGKSTLDSNLEIDSAIRDATYLLDQAEIFEDELPEKIATTTVFAPVGVFLLITPWNFPLATLLRKIVPALAYGNSVVVKPSEFTPGPAAFTFQLLHSLGLPSGTANLVLGTGSDLGPALLRHPSLQGVSFTGSTLAGRRIQLETAGRGIRLQLEMGGKNALVVLEDANLESAAEAACEAGFRCAGQWCTGTSRLIVEESIRQEFTSLLLNRISNLKVGPGFLKDYHLGPVIHEGRFREILQAIERAQGEGAECLAGGHAVGPVEGYHGYFIAPTLFANVSPQHILFHEEVFGPVLSLTSAVSIEDAIRLANRSEYGLSFSVFTRDSRKGRSVIEQVDAGICHLNLHTAYRSPDMPVAGWKQSGFGPPECGPSAHDFFTRLKAVYLNP